MDGGTNYPPYDIEAIGDNGYAVTLAVAGFEADDLTVEVRDGMLTVAGGRHPKRPRASRYSCTAASRRATSSASSILPTT